MPCRLMSILTCEKPNSGLGCARTAFRHTQSLKAENPKAGKPTYFFSSARLNSSGAIDFTLMGFAGIPPTM
jgi:hypothetical protein